MVQIEKRKKKGRPSKADLAARRAEAEAEADAGVSPSSAEVRRSLRRRSFRYNIIDYDEDYLDDGVSDEDDDVVVGDDDVEDDDDDDDEVEVVDDVNGDRRKRRGKKVKLVVKINNNSSNSNVRRGGKNGRVVSRRARVTSGESEDEDEREVKKRRINGGRVDEDEDEDDVDDDDVHENGENDEVDEEKDEKEEPKGREYVSGISNGDKNNTYDGNTPLPDKKQLELILDKLQKKDTYGVYSEPVDPEELPDYHDVIDHPMDFSTVRKKLANGSYSTLEKFESDVFLISSNAMEYNAPETVYHKQARAIKELGEKKFQRLRMQIERSEKEPKSEPKCEIKLELKSEQKERSYPLIKKQTKKLFYRGTQESLGTDFSSGATLATLDVPNTCGTDHVSSYERPSNNDGPVESVSFVPDNNLEKAEDAHTGKGILPKFGKKSFVVDENRRATYNISNQPEDRSESIFTTFDGDKKQLIPVGLSGEFPYARSLARFAANLGPRAWGIASKRIEQVLPPGYKHGRGWIGEYEPLPAAVFVVEHRKDPFVSRLHDVDDIRKDEKNPIVSRSLDAVNSRKDDKLLGEQAQATGHHRLNQPSSDGIMTTMFGSGGAKSLGSTICTPQQQNPFSKGSEHVMVKETESNCPSTKGQPNDRVFQQHSRFPRDSFCAENMGAKRVEPNSPSVSDQRREYVSQKQLPHDMGVVSDKKREYVTQKQLPHDMGVVSDKKREYVSQKQLPHDMGIGKKRVETNSQPTSDQKTDNVPQKQPHCLEMPTHMSSESLPKGKNFLQNLPFKQPDTNGGASDGLSNGKVVNNFAANNRVNSSSPSLMSPQLAAPAASLSQRQDQGLSDPVLVMKMLTEKAQKQQNGAIHAHNPVQARPPVPSARGDTGGPGNAAAAAASAWMSVGSAGFRPAAQNSATNRSQMSADSLHNATRMFYPQAMQPHVEYPVSAAMNFPPEKMGLPFKSFAQPPTKVGNEAQVPSRPKVFPPLVTNDLSRFQVQAPWRGPSPHTQQKQKQDTLPPDLNVAFQSSVDSQQPDLALQL
ncbi:Bromodomain and PHD finger-containing protein 3 [Bienertia sinuspersici]